MVENRPDPDELLARIEAEEKHSLRGKLKIFLGYAAGVGKTYAMLEAARLQKKEVDVVIAYIETHGRKETEALLEGLEIIPRRQAAYHGMPLTEMDIDAVLARKPKLTLVDELAHSNGQGSRHTKRYQDVEELLDAGIDVYTTLNIQHVESLQTVVVQVTGVWVRETVPDAVIDNADEIEIVDLPPDELLKRLQEGKVYISEQIGRAASEFFRKGNLIALRELTMRTAAVRVDEQMRSYMEAHAIHGPWKTAERLLVCISPGFLGAQLVRTARRLASQLRAEWFATYVETPGTTKLSQSQQGHLANTMRLAERLGGKAVTIQGSSVASAIADYARNNNITKVIVGKPQRSGLGKWFGVSIVNQVIRYSERFDVYVVSGKAEHAQQAKIARRGASTSVLAYLKGLGLLVLATILGNLVHAFFSTANIVMIYLLCVAITAVFWGFGPSIVASILAVLVFDFFFLPPYWSFTLTDPQYVFTFVALLVVGIMISYLMSMVRQQTEAAKRRERETAALYALGRDLAVANDLESYIHTILKRTRETFNQDAVIFLPREDNNRVLRAYTETVGILFDEKESAAAAWCFQHLKVAGYGTDTLPTARAKYFPLSTARGVVGVLAFQNITSKKEMTIEQERLLEAYADLIALAIESMLLTEEARDAQVLRATQKLQSAFLNSISLALSTPIRSIVNMLNKLKETGLEIDELVKQNLLQIALGEALGVNHMISNLLDMSKIEAGAIRPSLKPIAVKEMLDDALIKIDARPGAREAKIDIPPVLPPVLADFSLFVQAMINILDNAFKYSPRDSDVDIRARQSGRKVTIEVADRGVGIPPQDLQRVFEKFYRVEHPQNITGSALGLTISKGLIEAQGGTIVAENRPGGGTVIRLTMPTAGNK